MKVVPEMGRVH